MRVTKLTWIELSSIISVNPETEISIEVSMSPDVHSCRIFVESNGSFVEKPHAAGPLSALTKEDAGRYKK